MNIEGLEVLQKIEITTISGLGFLIGTLFFAIIGLASFAFAYMLVSDGVKGAYWCVLVGIVCFTIAFVFFNNVKKIPTGEYKYEVVCHTEEAFTEMYKNYDILNRNTRYQNEIGTIYTIKAKDGGYICENCQEELTTTDIFCSKCGAKQ